MTQSGYVQWYDGTLIRKNGHKKEKFDFKKVNNV